MTIRNSGDITISWVDMYNKASDDASNNKLELAIIELRIVLKITKRRTRKR